MKIGQNDPKMRSKMVKNGQKWSKSMTIELHGVSNFKSRRFVTLLFSHHFGDPSEVLAILTFGVILDQYL
jgi:hypothetical protein